MSLVTHQNSLSSQKKGYEFAPPVEPRRIVGTNYERIVITSNRGLSNSQSQIDSIEENAVDQIKRMSEKIQDQIDHVFAVKRYDLEEKLQKLEENVERNKIAEMVIEQKLKELKNRLERRKQFRSIHKRSIVPCL